MDAFDNPARNGMTGPERDGGSNEQSNRAAPGGEFLAAAANVTAAASIMPLAIQAILVPDASGRIVLPAGASIDDITISGTDLVITLPNGQVFIIPGGAVDVPSIVVDGDTVPASNVAQLLENLGELNPEAGVRSSGGNFADPEGPIQDAYALGDLLPYTELAFPQPEDRELLADVPDEEPTIVIVTPDQPAGVVAATASVDEAGLPARGVEAAGSNSAANSETTTGAIVYDAGDGLDTLTINGTAITAVGQIVTTPLGQLAITSLTPGNVGYSYTLTDNTNANNNLTDLFTVVVTDRDGDTATATLTISVVDDVPTARGDTDQVAAGSFAPETGNVLTGTGTTSGAAGADTPGADGASLTGIRGAGSEGGFSAPGTVQGQYGTLTINAQGGYTYVRTPGTPGGVNDVFSYQITDSDGDTSTATLTISIADAPTVITFVPGDGEGDDGTVVYEADLGPREGETPGSAFAGGEGGGDASTSGTITFTAIDGVGSVSIGGVVVTPGSLPQTISSDATGSLVVTGYSFDPATGEGSITYVYTLIDNTLDGDGTTVSFDLVITDADGDAASDTLDINIVDDTPTARADSDSVTEDGPTVADGNVLTGSGGEDANGTDGVADVQGADGATVTAVAGGTVGEPLAGTYGSLTLNGGGSYSYALNNQAQAVQGLAVGETLTETFTYTITDGDGDTSTTTLIITINGADDGVTINGINAEGGDLTVDEDDLSDGSSPDAAALTQAGSLSISTPDGLGNVTIGGTQVVTNGVFTPGTATSPFGTINITGFTPVTGADGSVIGGTFAYNYVLADNTLTHTGQGEDNVTDSFAVIVTDSDGSTGNDSIDVRIIDDVPTARDDVDSVTEDSGNGDNPPVADGNVLTGLGGGDANATDGVADTQGADGATVTAVTGGVVGEASAGAYGMLTLGADGSYAYELNNQAQPVQGLSAGETLTETFTYTITDGDGDISTATLTITIDGADDGVTIRGLDAEGAEIIVNEDDLSDGSSPDAAALTQPGSFTISTPDGLGNVTIGGTQVVTAGVFTAGTATSALGTVNITGFTPVIGADGSVIGGTFTYTYVLSDNTLTHTSQGEDFVGDSFAVVVTDSDGSSANASLDALIIDDVPTAANDSASAAEDTPVVIDVLGNDVRGADGVDLATGVVLATAPTKGSAVYNGDGTFTYTPTPGQEGEDSFTYTITDGDGDTSTATVTVALAKDSVPTINLGADNSVDEAGLPAGSNAASNSETATGSFTLTTGNDSVDTLVINGVDVTAGGTVTTPLGVLTVTVSSGAYSYSYTLTTNTSGDDTFDSFTAVVTDSDGDPATDTLVIDIVDDVPTANPDVDSVTEDGALTANGNVLTGIGGNDLNDTDGVLDVQGADGAAVTAVSFGATVGSVGAGLAGAYGTLTLNADGSYSYVLNNAAQPVQGLSAGQVLTEIFSYTITDGDGDPSPTTLTITIEGADDGVTITGLDAEGAELFVDEDDLPARAGEAPGSDTTPDGVTDSDSFTVSTPDGMGNVVLTSFNGVPLGAPLTLVVANGTFTPQSVATAYGTLDVTGFTAVTGADGSVIGGTFTYIYTLTDNRADHPAAGQDDRTDSIGVTVTDIDGSSASATIDIRITDDVPDAINDGTTQALENAPVTINVLANDVQGADSVQPSAVQLVGGSLTGTGTLVNNGDGSFTYTPGAQETGSVSFQYRITDGDGDTDVATATITLVADSAPQIRTPVNVTVDEDGLEGANVDNGLAGEVTSTGSASANGTIIVDFGSDVPAPLAGSLVLNDSAALDTQLTVNNVAVTFAKDGNDLVGSVAGNEVIRISLTTAVAGPGATEVTYGYTVTLSQAIDQAVAGLEDTDFLSGIGFTVTDSDGTTASGAFGVTIVDDLPTLNVSDAPTSVVEGATANGTWTLDAGADGVTSINVSFGSGSATLSLAPGSSVSITQPTGTLTVNANGTFSFAAAGNQNNAANPSATFTLSAVDRDNDPTSDSLTIAITDGANPTNAAPITLTVNEAALAVIGSNPSSPDETASGNLSFTAGSDTLSGFAFTGVAGLAANIDGAGTDLFWSMAPGGQTIIGSLTMGGPAAITISLTAPASIAPGATASATVTVTLADNLPHELAMAAQTAVLGTVTVQATDTDGDLATGVVTVQVIDDVPSVVASAAQPVLTVDETFFGTDAQASFASVFTPTFGADGAAAVNPTTYALGINAGVTGLVDTTTNEAVILVLNGGVVEGRTVTTNALVFTVSVAANGTVTLDQSRAVVHTPDSGPDQSTGLLADNLITLTATVTDGDGDTATATANIGQNLAFEDDAPVADDDSAGLTEGGPSFVTFDVDTNDNVGADGLGSRTFTSLTGSYGTITLNGDGTQTYTLTPAGQAAIDALPPGATLTDIFTYTLTDKDGDSDPATLTITLTGTDDGVTITNLTPAADGGDVSVDEDDLPAGSDTAKESLTQPGTFNISAPDGVDDLTIGGQAVITNGVFTAVSFVTPFGNTMNITAYNAATGQISYTYTLAAAELHANAAGENSLFENFAVVLTDVDNDTANGTLSVNIIDDVPTAAADAAIIVAEDAAPVGGNLLANDTRGADGATVTSVTIGATTAAIAAVGDTVIPTANGVYTFNAAGVWSFDPNPVNNAAPVDAGFSYTITDGDGDPSTAAQAISLIDGADPIGGGSITLALDDQNLADGSTPAGPDSANDTLVFTPGSDAIASIVFAASVAGLGGGLTWVRVSDTQITGSDGARLVVTLDLVRVGNNASVTATLNDNYDSHPGIDVDDLANLGSVGVVATDSDGDTATGTVTVTVSDDLPTARADTDAVTEDTATVATGDVLTGVGTTNAPDGADTLGADGAAVTGVAAGTSATAVTGNVGSALAGSYGSLTLNAGGDYTYTLNNGNAAVQALGVNESLTETFTYTITDGDGDTSTTTLTITINGSNDLPTIGSAMTAVSDEGLAGGFPDNIGTVDTTDLILRTGTIAVGDPDGDPLTLSLGAPATLLFSGGQPIVWDTTNPQLLLGKVGTETIISVAIDNGGNFTVSLQGPIDHPDTTQEDALSLVVPVSAFDGTTTVTNATALTIGLEDDSPVAIAPLAASLINAPGSSVYQSLDTDGDVDNNYGGDGPGSVIFTAATIAALQSQNLTSGGQALNYVISGGGTILTAEKPNGDDVFIIRLQPAGHADQYQVEMVQKLDSTQTVDFNSGGYNFVGGNTAWIGFVKVGDNNSQDILVTPMKNGVDGGTVNANNTETGVDNNNVGANEAVRVDFVIDLTGSPGNGQDYGVLANQNHAFDSHYNANGASALFTNINSSSSVRLVARDDIDTDNDIGDGVKDTITKVAISFNNATLSVTANGTYNVGGQNFTVTFANGEATVTGVVANTVVAGFTADGYNSIEFHHAGGDTFKIGDFGAVVQTENPVNFNVPVAIVDGDGDSAPGSLAITTASPLLVIGSATGDTAGEPTDHVVANPQGQVDGAIQGGAFDDTLVGDPGSVTITEGQQANVVLVLDSSGSMSEQIDFGGGTISRMQALKNGVNALIDSLSQSGAQDVRITVIDFDTDGDNLGTFDLIVNGVVQTGAVTAAKAAVNGMNDSGGTNYEDGLQDALSWINGGNGIAGADVNKVVFVSDGSPTYWNSGGGIGGNGSSADAANVENSMDQVLGIDDSTNEPQQILATGYSIDSVGINVDAPQLVRLSDVEDGNASGGTGNATNVTTAEQLAAVLQVLGGSTDLAAAGNDVINGGVGDDVIFGDVLYTDALATQLGVNLAPGSGWAVFQTLEGRVNAESLDPAGNGADWNRQDTIAYIRANHAVLGQESGRTGGNDTINAGAGTDIIYGQEGNDTINGGDGDDLISGGTGGDMMTGGAGADTFVVSTGESRAIIGGTGNAGTIAGFDRITGFDIAADILNLQGSPVAAGNATVDGTNSGLTIGGQTIKSHSITNGVITFDDADTFTTALSVPTYTNVAAVVDYLQHNNLGTAGTTVAFAAAGGTFLYEQVGNSPSAANDILVELQGVSIANLTTLIGTRITPVTLDLDGDGLEFVSVSAGAAFDYDGDGVREATSWVGNGDGILVRDANGDGIANNGSEIVFAVGGSTDLEGLRLQYDSNGDGKLSAEDAEFASFGVWQDVNGNGTTDLGEFRSLTDLGIVSIALTSDGKPYVAGDGEVIVHGEASFTRTDGSTAAVGDVSFITPRAANDVERAATNQALTSSLVAASLIVAVGDAQPDTATPLATAADDESVPTGADASIAAATVDAPAETSASLASDNLADTPETVAPDRSAALHSDDTSPASIDDAQDSGWRSEPGNNADAGNSDSLADLIADRGSFDPGLMDGLLSLAVAPAETATAESDAAAHDPAAVAVLAEVMESGAVDQLIDAITGGFEPVQIASGEAPAFDLAQFLDQKIMPDMAFPTSQPLEADLHAMAVA